MTVRGRGPEQPAHLARRDFLAIAGTSLAGGTLAATGVAGLGAAPALAAEGNPSPPVAPRLRVGYTMPTLEFTDSKTQSALGAAYESALTDLIGINTVYADSSTYDTAGLLSYPPGTFVRAGGGYPSPQRWTRDAAVNAWNAASLLSPLVGRNTLLAMVDKQPDGSLIVQQDNQWWDQIIWVVSAWNHYLVTGDSAFLADAYQISVHTMSARRAQNFNTGLGLFEGPSFMNDGIAGYPSPPWEPGIRSSFVLDYPNTNKLMCLSTNCLYYGAFLALDGMARALGDAGAAASYRSDAAQLRDAINKNLWRNDAGSYGYFVHGAGQLSGQLDTSEEGAGLAFAVMLGVANPDQTRSLLNNAHWEPHGIVNSWPAFSRFSDQKPGRHNVCIWPMVHSMFGHAAAMGGRTDLFARAVTDLAQLTLGSGGDFYEVYNSKTGAVDGGWQSDGSGELTHFTSQPSQAWSATGYLRMIYSGLFGLNFTENALRFAPCLPEGWGQLSLVGVPYRNATLDITLTGAGNHVVSCTVNDSPGQAALPAEATGHHTVRITLDSR